MRVGHAAGALIVSVLFMLTARPAAATPSNAQMPLQPRVPSEYRKAPLLLHDQGVPADHRPVSSSTSALRAEGQALYITHCASCHGANLAGGPDIPSLQQAGGSAVDFYLTTGRMPGVKPDVQAVHSQPHFTPHEIAALDSYVGSVAHSSIPIPMVVTNPKFLADGRQLFEENCQACHGAAGEGATAGGIWSAVPLYQANPTQIGEAIRFGPGVMPRFPERVLSDRDIDALATYIGYLQSSKQDFGGLTMGYLGPVAEGAVGALIGIGVLFWVIYFTGTKADGSRLHE